MLVACSNPLPEDKIDYAGSWNGTDMDLQIQESGNLEYARIKDGVTTSITGPIKEFDGDNFIVGFAFLTTTFEVSTPPYQDDGVWKMVVDGVELSKTR